MTSPDRLQQPEIPAGYRIATPEEALFLSQQEQSAAAPDSYTPPPRPERVSIRDAQTWSKPIPSMTPVARPDHQEIITTAAHRDAYGATHRPDGSVELSSELAAFLGLSTQTPSKRSPDSSKGAKISIIEIEGVGEGELQKIVETLRKPQRAEEA